MMEDAESHAVVGQCAEARSEVPPGLALSRDNLTLERASRVLALCGAAAEASSLSSELAKRFPSATLTVHVALPVTAALLAIERADPARGVELLEPAKPYDHAASTEFWPLYVRGLAYLRLKNGPAAAVEFKGIVDHPGEVPGSILYPQARLGLARAAAMAHDTATARKQYEEVFAHWKDADPTLQPLKEARLEYSRLPS
jgi:hypothetical protein